MSEDATNEMIAERLFGWKWISYMGRPVRSHERCNDRVDIRVRRFVSPASLKNKRWIDYLQENLGDDATGDEPLCYSYCSSAPSESPPDCLGVQDYDVLNLIRNHWKKNYPKFWLAFTKELPEAHDYKRGDFSRAAIRAISKTDEALKPLPTIRWGESSCEATK